MATFLVVAHQTASAPELRAALIAKKRDDRRAIFVLLVPATPVHELQQVQQGDSATVAEESISAARAALEPEGLDFARTIVGDADPLTAIQDEFRRARRTYDGIILSTLPLGDSRWLSRGLPAEIAAMFQVPLIHVIASDRSLQAPGDAVMTASVVTFTVRLGSQGTEIAKLVAEQLGYRYYDWEITSLAAERAGVSPNIVAASEQAQSLLERVLNQLLVSGVYSGDESVGRLSSTTMSSAILALGSRQYREFVERVVLELAEHGGAVIVGHAGQVVLRDKPGMFKVMITGLAEQRAHRVAAEENRTIEAARKAVRESDEERKAFFKHTYHVDLLDADLYDLTLNSDSLSPEVAARTIITAVSAPSGSADEKAVKEAGIQGSATAR